MNMLYQLLGALAAAGLIWFTWRTIQARPDWFDQKQLMKSLSTMGILALGLIGFIGLCVMFLRAA